MPNMSANTSPQAQGKTAGRRVNNLPVYILVGVLGLFVLVMALVAMDRSQHQHANKVNAEKAGNTDTAMFVKAILPDRNDGIIPDAAGQPGPPEIPKEQAQASGEQELKVPIVKPNDLNKPPAPPERDTNKPKTSAEEEEARIRQMKFQAFEQAVTAKTVVQVTDLSGKRTLGEPGLNTPEAVELSKLIAAQTEDSIKALAQIPGGGVAKTGVSRNDIKQFAGIGQGDRWRMDSKPEPPRTRYELRAGFVVPATMISGINSGLPGQVIGQVSQNVYDTPTGKYLLIPQGSRLVGAYSSDVVYGQERVLVAWQRIVFPDGKAMDIGAMPGADGAGYAGFHDKVNNHYLRTFGSALLMSAIIAGVSLSQPNQNNGVNNTQSTSGVLSASLGQELGSTMAEMMQKNLSLSPTLEIRPGFRFNVMAVKDLTFEKPYKSFDYALSGKGGK
ncbi:MAG: TrbI/VirB10 family protein [Syntrophobacteraceae bacterium]